MAQRLRDVHRGDAGLLFDRIKLGALASIAGGALGAALFGNVWAVLAGAVLGAYLSHRYIEAAGALAQRIFLGGDSTPMPPDYSQAKALAIQGKYDAAIAELKRDITAAPEAAEPYLLAARMLRDGPRRYEESAAWFVRARKQARMTPGESALLARELTELYCRKIGDPRRALPELARLADTSPDPATRAWAQGELTRIRSEPLRIPMP